jgi:hypothetical protein
MLSNIFETFILLCNIYIYSNIYTYSYISVGFVITYTLILFYYYVKINFNKFDHYRNENYYVIDSKYDNDYDNFIDNTPINSESDETKIYKKTELQKRVEELLTPDLYASLYLYESESDDDIFNSNTLSNYFSNIDSNDVIRKKKNNFIRQKHIAQYNKKKKLLNISYKIRKMFKLKQIV